MMSGARSTKATTGTCHGGFERSVNNTWRDWTSYRQHVSAGSHDAFCLPATSVRWLVRITQGKPVQPSFLIEVMALELLHPPFGNDYRYEIKSLLASLADRLDETWGDPAKLGPPVSDGMDQAARSAA